MDIAVPRPLLNTFTYAIPADLAGKVLPGARVFVPFGARHLVGVAVRIHDQLPKGPVKEIAEVLDEEPLFSESLLELGLWTSSYYLAPPGETLRIMLPPGLLARKAAEKESPSPGRLWPSRNLQSVVEVRSGPGKLTPVQAATVEALRTRPLPIPVQAFLGKMGVSRSVLHSLQTKGWIRIEEVEMIRSPWGSSDPDPRFRRHPLTAEQKAVFSRIKERLDTRASHNLLLHGVTGSGKTELYLNAIAHVRSQGRSALVLVPEIGLTPQISRAFRCWFGEEVAILHSALSAGERFDQWRKIRSGEAPVVVGTRSAVFAPLKDLGIIVVDEEHDGSYKQEDAPRYNARDVARKRAGIEKALVLLGSATPQLETFYASMTRSDPECLSLSARVLDRPLATVRVVDMREEFQKRGKAVVLSAELEQRIRERLGQKEQVLILLNRRGYASALLCRSCGSTELCDNCSISLTYHQRSARLVCHYCGHSRGVPASCGECKKRYIHFLGHGTEQIQEIVESLFPEAGVDRLDRDTTKRKGSLERILGAFAAGKTDILIGTQMIAKGHDFPRVTLVGVLGAEQALRFADFRAAERTFQLLTQVAGRAGRGTQPGEVVIQTYYPNHYSLKYARSQDYARFYEEELKFRSRFRYPPFSALANIRIQSPSRPKVEEASQTIAETLLELRRRISSPRRMRVLGPAQAPLERLKGQYRFHILIKTTSRRELHEVLRGALEELASEPGVLRVASIDIDPINLL